MDLPKMIDKKGTIYAIPAGFNQWEITTILL